MGTYSGLTTKAPRLRRMLSVVWISSARTASQVRCLLAVPLRRHHEGLRLAGCKIAHWEYQQHGADELLIFVPHHCANVTCHCWAWPKHESHLVAESPSHSSCRRSQLEVSIAPASPAACVSADFKHEDSPKRAAERQNACIGTLISIALRPDCRHAFRTQPLRWFGASICLPNASA